MQTVLGNGDIWNFVSKYNSLYRCRKCKKSGKRLSPLVGYTAHDGPLQWTGEIYINCHELLRHERARLEIIQEMQRLLLSDELLEKFDRAIGFAGAPTGGRTLADELASATLREFLPVRKQVDIPESATSRERSRLVFEDYVPQRGESWLVVDDICHHGRTVGELSRMILSSGARVLGILCFISQNPAMTELEVIDGVKIPIFPIATIEVPAWREDDLVVSADVHAGKLIRNPKRHWAELMEKMIAQRA